MGKLFFIILITILPVALAFYAYSKYEKSTQMTTESVLDTFMDDLTERDYKDAFSFIAPKLATKWTFDRFEKDLKEVRSAVNNWKPEVTGSFTGVSLQGTSVQTTYQLDSDWRSLSSIDLVVMSGYVGKKIAKINICIPYIEKPPEVVKKIAEQFVLGVQMKDYESVGELMSPHCRHKFPDKILANLQPSLKTGSFEFSEPHRICKNSVWYSAISITSTVHDRQLVELVISTTTIEPKIASLNF